MSVDERRETFHVNRVSAADLDERLIAQSYRPDVVAAVVALRSKGARPLSSALSGRITQGRTPEYGADGDACLKTRNVVGGLVDAGDVDRVSLPFAARNANSRIGPKTVLMNRSGAGSIGRVSIYLGTAPVFTNEELFRFRVSSPHDPAFIAIFFGTALGERVLERGVNGSTGQLKLVQEHVENVPVLLPQPSVQRYIGDKVRQAERLRETSRSIEHALQRTFDPLSIGLPKSPKAWRNSARILDPYRLNPSHYDPVVLQMLNDAKSKVKVLELGRVFGDRGISGGATPFGADYRDSGVFFVRVQNVKPYRLDLSDTAYLSTDQDQQLARSRCSSDDIVFSITGYPGTASLVMEEDLPVNLNQHCVRFDIRAPHDAAYIVAAMNSPFVKRQIDRLAIGGTRDALDYPSVRSLLIPLLDDSVMEEIGKSVRTLIAAARLSRRLIVAAKCLAEALIEGKITESELIEIQQSIDESNYRPDRALLARLTPNGIDVADAPKLFPDLDSLYRVLEDASLAAPAEAK